MTIETLERLNEFIIVANQMKAVMEAAPEEEKIYSEMKFAKLHFEDYLGAPEAKIKRIKEMISNASNNTVTITDDLITKIINYANS